jgi:8-oxo-dGTP pyrophosphatase MutT (NUDIX family)
LRAPSASLPRALALAAIRETFEETGLLLGQASPPVPRAPAGMWRQFADHGVSPALSSLTLVARAITPPGRPKRFDTRFLTIDASAIAKRIEGITGPQSELIELAWVSLGEAKALDLPAITHVVLDELRARIAAGFAPELPAPFFYSVRRAWRRDNL